MDGWGTEGAAVGLFWHAINEVRKFMKPDVRASDLSRIETKVDEMTKEVINLRIHVAGLNGAGGGKK